MANASDISVGLAADFIRRAVRAGFEPHELKRLADSDTAMKKILKSVRRGDDPQPRIFSGKLIDLGAPALDCDGWEVVRHDSAGQWHVGSDQLSLVVTTNQSTSAVTGHALKNELKNQPGLLNATALDHLCANPKFIPASWKADTHGRPQYITFWGTEYKGELGGTYVRCLCWDNGRWCSSFRWLGFNWDACGPAAVLLR